MLGIDLQTLYVFQAFAAAVVAANLIVYLIPRRSSPSARSLMLLMSAVALWSLFYGLEFKSTGLESKLVWVRMEYLAAAWTGVFFFQFALTLTGRMSWLSGVRKWILFIIPALTILAVFTNEHHQLIWSKAWIDGDGPVTSMAYQRGIGFWVFVAYSYGMLLAGTVHLFYNYLFLRQIEGKHFWVTLIGVLAPWATNILYLMEIEPIRHIDLTPAAFALSGVAFFWGTIRHQMLELIPIARDAVIKSMKDAVFVLDLRHRVIDLNMAAQQLIPEQTKVITGKPLSRILPDLFKQLKQSEDRKIDDLEMSIPRGETTGLWRMRQAALYSHGNTFSGWLITLQDITEQRRNEIALRESEERFRSISANALDSIVMIDPSGQVSFWNRAAEKMFGYLEAEILGKDLYAYLVPEGNQTISRHAFSEFRHTGKGHILGKTIEIECLHKNGTRFPAELSLSPLKLNDQWHAAVIVRDITERKKTQDYLIQSEKMLSVGGLAAGMAHEINNPLAGILANVQVMRMRLLSDLPANVSAADECKLDVKRMWAYMGKRGILEMIEAIDQSCQRAAVIVRNMLAFSRKSDAVFSDHDLASLVDQTVDLAKNDFQLKKQHDFRQIQIVRDYVPDMPSVSCDAGQIQQVIFNILKNGTQAMWAGKAKQSLSQFILSVDRQDDWGCITITDNGPGMTDDIRKRIFEPFYTTKPTGSGTGLGLSIAYFIITKNHGGMLSVASTLGQGTAFVIKLPLKCPPKA